ncbi:hypothetical protein HMPREF9554_00437 [Treponema phagedenis F0421]|nr:hypothetical protein HMPREF9554_00437 [Treponema phagedenis F0421]
MSKLTIGMLNRMSLVDASIEKTTNVFLFFFTNRNFRSMLILVVIPQTLWRKYAKKTRRI